MKVNMIHSAQCRCMVCDGPRLEWTERELNRKQWKVISWYQNAAKQFNVIIENKEGETIHYPLWCWNDYPYEPKYHDEENSVSIFENWREKIMERELKRKRGSNSESE